MEEDIGLLGLLVHGKKNDATQLFTLIPLLFIFPLSLWNGNYFGRQALCHAAWHWRDLEEP